MRRRGLVRMGDGKSPAYQPESGLTPRTDALRFDRAPDVSIAAVSPARDLPPESRTPPRDPRSFQTLAGGIIAGAATALGASVYWWHEAARPSLGGLLGFVVLVAMASLLRVR